MISPLNRRASHLLTLVWQLTVRELRGRYVGSAAGFFWSIFHPLIRLAIWTYVFSYILKLRFSAEGGVSNFALYLFCGMVPFLAFQETVQNCTVSVVNHASLVKNLVFPSKAIQLSIGLSSLISEFIGIGILIVGMLILGYDFPIYLPLVIPVAVLLMFFSMGIGLLACTLHVFFRDTAQIIGVLTLVWLYATPIFYPVHLLPSHLSFLMYVNPLAYVVNVYRSLLLVGDLPSLQGGLIFLLVSLGTFLVGYHVYTLYYPYFIDEL